MENLQGRQLNGYKLEERIGNGGFGAVYRAKQSTIGREVAVKFILPGYANNPDFIRRFQSEAHLIARLEHPHITPLHDFWRDPSGAYLVMRFLRGGSVRDSLEQEAFELNAVSLLLDQIASALDFAHRHDVIHRDIKPGNILLDEDGNAYLADFGIAKDLTGVVGNMTAADAVMGSLDYISPEQARSEPVTARTDIYSLGVTIYEMISGHHPFENASSVERLYKHCNDPLPEITSVPDEMRQSINVVMQKATAKNPEHRYSDVLAFAAAFRESIGRGTIQADANVVEQLTMREQEVLFLIAKGMSNHEIAAELVVSIGTVKWHITQLYKKLGVRSRVQAIVRARELNLIVGDDFDDLMPDLNGSRTTVSLPEPENPYKGLHAFQMTDARDFYGRTELTNKLIERMCEDDPYQRFLAIVGPSGSGKSSLVKAGLIPALWKGAIAGSEKWFVVDMMPGTHPLDKLETALVRVAANQASNLREQLQRDARGLLRIADIILPGDDTELVIIIDQFEEVFTLVEDEGDRQQFLDLLRMAVSNVRSRIRIIVTLRADYYDRPLHYPEFGELVRSQMETVLPLNAQGLERAVRGPAERVGVTFERGLVEQIVSSMNYQAGALPLLQYALTELFDRRDGRTITHNAYQQIGGAAGALATRADEIYVSLTDEAQQLAHQMFMRLVTLGEGAEDTRRRVSQAELLSLTENADLMEEIIDQFVLYRLLSLDHDPATRQPTVEVGHEAILREWERLRKWLNESRSDIRQERAVARGAEEWDAHKRDTSFLLRGARLDQAERWQDSTTLILTPLEQEFIDNSLTQREQEHQTDLNRKKREAHLERRSRNFLGALVGVFAIAAVIAGYLAIEAQSNFSRAERIRFAAQAQIALDNGADVRIPALLALRSLDIGYSPEADAALLSALSRDFARQSYVGHAGNGITGVYFSPDGNRVLTTSADATARLWDTFSGEEIHRYMGHEGFVNGGAFTPDGRFVVTSSDDSTVRQWDVATGTEIRIVVQHERPLLTMALSPDGQFLATSDDVNNVQVLRFDTAELVHELVGHTSIVNRVAFSPDGRTVATASGDGTIRLWDLETGEELRVFEGHAAGIISVAYAPTGDTLVSGGEDTTIRIWSAETGEELQRLIGHTGNVISAVYSPDGRFIASSGSERIVRLWDAETGQEIQQLRGHTTQAGFVEFSPDNRYLISGGVGNVSLLWELHLESEPRKYAVPFGTLHAESVAMAELSNNDQQIITVLRDGVVRIWDVANRRIDREFAVEAGDFVNDAVLFSEHNQILLVSQDGVVRQWDLNSQELIRQYSGHDASINGVAMASSGGIFVTGSDDNVAIIWRMDSDEPLLRLEGHTDAVNSVALSPDNRHVVTASQDGTARLWSAETGVEIRQFVGHEAAVLSAEFSPDGRAILTGSEDHKALLWDTETGDMVQQFTGHTLAVRQVAFSPDGNFVATGSQDQTVRLWNTETGEVIRNLIGHDFPILSLSVSADGDQLLAANIGETYLWRTGLDDVIALTCQKLSSDFTPEERDLYAVDEDSRVCT